VNRMDAIEYFKGMRKRLCEDHLELLPKKSVGYQTTLREMSFYDAAIKALEQQPCEDAISRQAVLEGLASIAKAKAKSDAQKSMMGRTMFFVERLPSVSTEKTGRWITTRTFMHDGEYYCNKCKCDAPNNEKWDYCPNCGAKMLPQPYKAESEG